MKPKTSKNKPKTPARVRSSELVMMQFVQRTIDARKALHAGKWEKTWGTMPAQVGMAIRDAWKALDDADYWLRFFAS